MHSKEGRELIKNIKAKERESIEAWVSDIVHQEGNLNRVDMLLAAKDVSVRPKVVTMANSPRRLHKFVWSIHR